MHAVVRTYSGAGAKDLFGLLEKRKADVEAVMRPVPGLVSYTLVRTGDGGLSVTVCKDKAGTEASMRAAKEWIQKNASALGSNPPAVAEGSVVIQIS
jgi:hypothetical protein